jgi:hypothetical protein
VPIWFRFRFQFHTGRDESEQLPDDLTTATIPKTQKESLRSRLTPLPEKWISHWTRHLENTKWQQENGSLLRSSQL